MITGGVLDAKEKGVPGELKMPPEMVKVVCERAHEMGYTVAAHVESAEGVRVALENGVDSIEEAGHGYPAAVPGRGRFWYHHYALFDQSVSKLVKTIIECAKAALEQDIPVVLGNDVGCPWKVAFHKYVGCPWWRPAGGYRAGDRHAGTGKGGGPHRYGGGPTGRPAGAAPCRAGRHQPSKVKHRKNVGWMQRRYLTDRRKLNEA